MKASELTEFINYIAPLHNKLIERDDRYITHILDMELDPIEVELMEDEVQLNVEDYTYIKLDRETLEKLLDLMDEIDEKH